MCDYRTGQQYDCMTGLLDWNKYPPKFPIPLLLRSHLFSKCNSEFLLWKFKNIESVWSTVRQFLLTMPNAFENMVGS